MVSMVSSAKIIYSDKIDPVARFENIIPCLSSVRAKRVNVLCSLLFIPLHSFCIPFTKDMEKKKLMIAVYICDMVLIFI